jgi:hypothetical protein
MSGSTCADAVEPAAQSNISRPQTSARANVLARRMDGNGVYFFPWFPAWVPPQTYRSIPPGRANYA